MRQRLTLLKDLPDYPAGTVFYIEGVKGSHACKDGPFYEVSVPSGQPGRRDLQYLRVGGSIIDDPSWFKREADVENAVDLRCPLCGETRGEFFSTKFFCSDMDSYRYGVQYSVGFECVNGHRRVLYGTEFGNKKLREEIGLVEKVQQIVKETQRSSVSAASHPSGERS